MLFRSRFAKGAAKLTPALARDVALVAARARGRTGWKRLVIEVYADKPGDTPANESLAARRAEALRKAFVAAGIAESALTVAVGDLAAKRAPTFDARISK